jgi:hypothetical protein
MLHSLLHDLNARNMYKDDKYGRRFNCWKRLCIYRDFGTVPRNREANAWVLYLISLHLITY